MKKILLFLVAFFSLYAQAQIQRTEDIDFTTESAWRNLIPDFMGEPGNTSDFQTITGFQVAKLNFLFSKGTIRFNTDDKQYNLTLLQGGEMTISVPEGCVINKVEFTTAVVSDLVLAQGEQGEYNPDTRTWTSEDGVSSVKFKNFVLSSYIWSIRVVYTEPSAVLTAKVSLENDAIVSSFDTMRLTFNTSSSNITIQNPNNIRITGNYDDTSKGSIDKVLAATVSGKDVVLSLEKPITQDGTFTVEIPEKSFKDEDGYENVSINCTFKVRAERATFMYESINPDTKTEATSVTFPITLKFPSNVGHADTDKRFRLFVSGKEAPIAQVQIVTGDNADEINLVVLNNTSEKFTDYGTYTLTIDEKTIYDINYGDQIYERYNPEFTITYVIPEPTDPLKEEKDEANRLVRLAGNLGYPSEDAAVTTALKELLANENANKEQYESALESFYNSTEVVLPSQNNWYTIASVNSEGKHLYLKYVDGAIVLDSKASSFKANTVDGNILVFETEDGKFLHVLMTSDEYQYTSSKNVTNSKSYVNNLTLEKLAIPDADSQKDMLGLFTIKGGMGNNSSGDKVGDAYALVNHADGSILTSPDETVICFSTDKTNAFELKSSSEPQEVITPIASLSVTSIKSSSDPMTMAFENISKVSLLDATKPYVVKEDGVTTADVLADKILTKLEENDNVFAVHVNGLDFGSYTLVLPVGTFDYSENDKEVNDKEIRLAFAIVESNHNFNRGLVYNSYPQMYGDTPIHDTDLNNFRIFIYKGVNHSDLFADSDKKVKLCNFWNAEVYREGHFELDTEFRRDTPAIKAYKIVWEPTIESGDYSRPFDAGIQIAAETLGDANFGAWLNDHESVAEEDCIVNSKNTIFFRINNETAGISNVLMDNSPASIIYDLQGRRVQQMDKKGVYIVNGRKVVKR